MPAALFQPLNRGSSAGIVVLMPLFAGVALSTSDDVVMFRGRGQLALLVATLIFAAVAYMRRDRFEHVGLS